MARTDFLDMFYDPLQETDVREALKLSIGLNEDEIMDLNRQQLDKGLDSEGKSLGKYASFKYKGRYQPVDLKLTGEFRDKFSLQIDDKGTEIFSQDVKEAKLVKRYGKNIFGIPSPLIDNMAEIVREDFVTQYGYELQKKINR